MIAGGWLSNIVVTVSHRWRLVVCFLLKARRELAIFRFGCSKFLFEVALDFRGTFLIWASLPPSPGFRRGILASDIILLAIFACRLISAAFELTPMAAKT